MSAKSSHVSVAIVTKDRHLDLIHCFGSLMCQTEQIDELIIIDNSEGDSTKGIVENFRKLTKFPVRYRRESRIGYPIVRNKALKLAKYDWIAFIDDDCIADQNWYYYIKKSIQESSDWAILGDSKPHSVSVFSTVSHLLESYWKKKGTSRSGKITDLEILDTKNVAFNKKLLGIKKISFDESRVNVNFGASEDCDIGMKIQKSGGSAKFDHNIIVHHKDPTNIVNYYQKLVKNIYSHVNYEHIWMQYRRQTIKKQQNKFLSYFFQFSKKNNLRAVIQVQVLFHALLSILITKVTKFVLRKSEWYL